MSVADLLVISTNLVVAFAVAAHCIRRDRGIMQALSLAEVLREPISGFSIQN